MPLPHLGSQRPEFILGARGWVSEWEHVPHTRCGWCERVHVHRVGAAQAFAWKRFFGAGPRGGRVEVEEGIGG